MARTVLAVPARLRAFYTRPRNLYAGYIEECLPWLHCNDARTGERKMLDLIFVGLIVGFFALSAGLIRFCASLMGKGGRS
jgi:hypothetical protein